MEIFPASILHINVPAQMPATDNAPLNIPHDDDVEATEYAGTASFASYMHENLEDSVISDAQAPHVNMSMEEGSDDTPMSTLNAVSSDEQVMEEEKMDPFKVALYISEEGMLNADDRDIEGKAEDITTNVEGMTVNTKGLEVPGEDALSESEPAAELRDKTHTAASLVDDLSTSETEMDMHEDVTAPSGEEVSDLENIECEAKERANMNVTEDAQEDVDVPSGEEVSDRENVECEAKKRAQMNVGEDSQDAEPDETIRIRTEHGSLLPSGQDSDDSGFHEKRENPGVFENKIAAEGASQMPSDRFTHMVEKLPPEKSPVTHAATDPFTIAAGEQPEALNDSSRLTGSIFTKSVTRTAGLNEVLNRIVYVIKGNNRLGVSVEHDLLGKININVSMEKGMVHVHINAAEKIVSAFLEDNLHYLMDELAREGVTVGGFSFGMTDGNNDQEEHSGNHDSMTGNDEPGQIVPGNRTGRISIFA